MPTKNHDRPPPMAGPLEPFPSLHDLAPHISAVDWLWPAWIPRGMLTLLGAAPGVGKSLVALDLARRVIHGLPFPDAAPVAEPLTDTSRLRSRHRPQPEAPAPHASGGQRPELAEGQRPEPAGGQRPEPAGGQRPELAEGQSPGRNVLIVDAEGVPALLKQRAQAWDIDTRRLFLMLGQGPANHIDLADRRQQILFMNMIAQVDPGLVIIDSLAAATSRGETSLHGARDLLAFLATVARKGRLPLLIIHHLRKRAGRTASAAGGARVAAGDLRGSSHISAAARSILALSPVARASTPAPSSGDEVPQTRDFRRLQVIKSNLCRIPPPLGLIFEGDDQAVPTLRYTSLDEVLAAAGSLPPPTQLELCAAWLLQFLADAGQPLKPALIIQAAAAQGFPQATLYRARQTLGASIVDLGSSPRDPRKRWALSAPDEAPAAGEHTPRRVIE